MSATTIAGFSACSSTRQPAFADASPVDTFGAAFAGGLSNSGLRGGAPAEVAVHSLDDGLVVRLSGVLDAQGVAVLRRALLRPLPAQCRDVVIDAGGLADITDAAVAVLLAAAAWCRAEGRRFGLTTLSPASELLLAELDLDEQLHRI